MKPTAVADNGLLLPSSPAPQWEKPQIWPSKFCCFFFLVQKSPPVARSYFSFCCSSRFVLYLMNHTIIIPATTTTTTTTSPQKQGHCVHVCVVYVSGKNHGASGAEKRTDRTISLLPLNLIIKQHYCYSCRCRRRRHCVVGLAMISSGLVWFGHQSAAATKCAALFCWAQAGSCRDER